MSIIRNHRTTLLGLWLGCVALSAHAQREIVTPPLEANGTTVQLLTPANPQLQTTARFYLPFAAMAAKVYDTGGRSSETLRLAASSSWLRDELRNVSEDTRKSLADKLESTKEREATYRRYVSRQCAGALASSTLNADDAAVRAFEQRCGASTDPNAQDTTTNEQASTFGPEPSHWKQCEYTGEGSRPLVPTAAMLDDWQPVVELQRSLHPRGWSFFVPGLALDVWRRRAGAQGESPVVEYAVVFRGTEGGGGWLSNFRALTAFTPAIWDQYRQARLATIDLVNQIYQLHALSDALFEREAPTRIRITTVGHSLGGGLATFAFLEIPQITRVVSFDPSPVNGASLFAVAPSKDTQRSRNRDRESVLRDRRQPLHRDSFDETANIFVLNEKGEILSTITGCANGPLWGAEGGPVVRCDEPNLSGGSAIRQHNMPQLACKLFLASKGIITREQR